VNKRTNTAGPGRNNLIAERIREARRRTKPIVSQVDLSARVKEYGVQLNQASISKIERGVRIVTDVELLAIAKALYVPVGWLVGEYEFYGSAADVPPAPKAVSRLP
jgi:HTH-type transcriptional regulator, cell division transcriptional repressor